MYLIILVSAISAIVIAVSMIVKYCKKLKYSRKIVFITNGQSFIDATDVKEILNKIKQDSIELVILCVQLVLWCGCILIHFKRRGF